MNHLWLTDFDTRITTYPDTETGELFVYGAHLFPSFYTQVKQNNGARIYFYMHF